MGVRQYLDMDFLAVDEEFDHELINYVPVRREEEPRAVVGCRWSARHGSCRARCGPAHLRRWNGARLRMEVHGGHDCTAIQQLV